MTTPQIEQGYTKIANEIVGYLAKTYMSSYESQILWAIFSKTYGFNKKEDWVSNSQFVEITGMHKAHVSRTLKKLMLRKIVTQSGNKIAFQKDSRLWCKLPKQATVTQTGTSVTQTGQKVTQMGFLLPKQADTKDNIQKTITKDTITKDIAPSGARINELIKLFEPLNPNYELIYANKTQRASLVRMVVKFRENKITNALKALPEIIKKPYAPRITTPIEFENKFGQLVAFVRQEQAKKNKGGAVKI